MKASFRWKPFSQKQKQILTWWMPNSPYKYYKGIIADGAIRSGKTICMSLSFVIWAMSNFCGQNFGMCGKTIASFRRNVWFWLRIVIVLRGYRYIKGEEANSYIIYRKDVYNIFYIFGGKDESSQNLIQGITLAGLFCDEVVLMPQSFVNQATGRCSVDGAKQWFNCNPSHPAHHFKTDFIDRKKELKLVYIHFEMDDNLSLSEERKEYYRTAYTGVFFKRFILGLWVMAEGAIYDMWDDDVVLFDDNTMPVGLKSTSRRYITCDYGTTNPCVFLDIYDDGKIAWVVREYYYDSKKQGRQKTDSEYGDDMVEFVGEEYPNAFILDPSAASFKAELRKRGYRVIDADNSVNDGIRMVSTMLGRRLLRVHKSCKKTRDEHLGYVWNDKKAEKKGKEEPLKENDHSCDALRYFVKTIIKPWRLAG